VSGDGNEEELQPSRQGPRDFKNPRGQTRNHHRRISRRICCHEENPLSAFAEDHACVPKPLPPWGPSAKTCTSVCRHGLCPWMNADSAVRSFVCRWANATADSATGGYPAEALGSRTGRFHRRGAQAGISWRYHGLCPWGSIGILRLWRRQVILSFPKLLRENLLYGKGEGVLNISV
jgi:hypothetical protein